MLRKYNLKLEILGAVAVVASSTQVLWLEGRGFESHYGWDKRRRKWPGVRYPYMAQGVPFARECSLSL